ncbi:putative signaling protein [Granulosicoccus antarcticus IMCC3135]|uniref:Putative signaling protein n=2 Tax=Granulosicoccus TaxID=437504 RepID=A0A2Z2NIH4_9GAMM|nr:putative signaling protein [Granulosicoccus antarcticus IMCC3135]
MQRSQAVKLAFSLSMLLLCLLFMADLLTLRGNPANERQAARKVVAESLAIQLSTLVNIADKRALQHAISEFVMRNEDVLAASIARFSGEKLAEYGELDKLTYVKSRSTPTHMIVPILENKAVWGNVRVAFRSVGNLVDDLVYFGFLVTSAFLAFGIFLKRVLLQLDPSRAVPVRVNSAFNLFSEGVVILDSNLLIMLTNQSAARMLDKEPETQLGKRIDDWPWVKDEGWQAPWETAFNTGLGVSEQSLYLQDKGEQRLIVVSCTLIGEEDPTRSGVMVTLNDMSAMQKKNRELSVINYQLKKSKESISEKNRELETLAWRDPLTGLLNRRKFLENFQTLLEEALEHSRPLVCVMLDIDFFKAINDNYGHAAGDEVICAVAAQLSLASRETDIVGRYGGEEFVLVMPDTTIEQGLEISDRLRLSILKLSEDVTVPVPRVAASLGVADVLLEAGHDSTDAMLDRADKALYGAKESGRNRVVAFDPDTLALLAANKAAHEDQQVVVSKGQAESRADQAASEVDEKNSRSTGLFAQAPEDSHSHEAVLSEQADAVKAFVSKHNEVVERLKSHDLLTQLPLRQLFMHAVENELLRADRLSRTVGIVSIEIKELSRLQSSLGHQEVEIMIKEVIGKIQEELRASDMVTRINEAHSISHLAENEYGILLSDLAESEQALPIVTRIRRLLLAPMVLNGKTIYLGFNIGVALFPECGDTAVDLVEAATRARIEAAKQPEKVSYFFASTDMERQSREYLQLESDLYLAVEEKKLEVYFQPKFDLASRTISSVEALVRWKDETRGFVSPVDFIPIAETNGLIRQIFHQVLEASLQQIVEWDNLKLAKMKVSVNLSASQLRDPELVSHVLTALDNVGLAPERLEIELTETSIIQSPQRARIALGQLHDAGVTISMDDFGTGYTSIGLLAELPLDSVKIDRSFIVAMQTSERSRAIVESVINMAHTLRLLVVAEGVETNEQLTTLDALGCNEIQGYLISRPLPGLEITELLRRETLRRARSRAA